MEKDNKKEKTTSWSWKMSPEELKEQVEGYNTLKITQSYRGVSVLVVGALLLLGFVFAYFGVYASMSDMFLSLVIYIPVLFFVYKGHRWAIISLFILWTIEKIYTLYLAAESGGFILGSIIWWFIVAPYIYKALLVENARRKGIQNPAIVTTDVVEGVYCTKCGTKAESDGKFCTKCGTQLSSLS